MLSLVGLTCAVTPMVLYTGASLNGSGLEIAAGVATAAGLLRLGRAQTAPGWVWISLAGSGAALALSRSTGVLWLAVLVLCAAISYGAGPLRRALRESRAATLATGGLWALACVLAQLWERAVGAEVPADFTPLGPRLSDVPPQAIPFLRSVVGQFGYLDVAVPDAVHVSWAASILGLVLVACRLATGRERLGLLGVMAVTAMVPLFLMVAVEPNTGFALQGRHVLPVLVTLPLAAGEVLRRHAGRSTGRLGRAVMGAATLVVCMHGLSFYVAARTEAGGEGLLWFLDNVSYEPPAGWLPWIAIAALAPVIAALGLWTGRAPGRPLKEELHG